MDLFLLYAGNRRQKCVMEWSPPRCERLMEETPGTERESGDAPGDEPAADVRQALDDLCASSADVDVFRAKVESVASAPVRSPGDQTDAQVHAAAHEYIASDQCETDRALLMNKLSTVMAEASHHPPLGMEVEEAESTPAEGVETATGDTARRREVHGEMLSRSPQPPKTVRRKSMARRRRIKLGRQTAGTRRAWRP